MTKTLEMLFYVEYIVNNYSYLLDEKVVEHQKSLSTMTVAEAMESISQFFNENNAGCCLYCVTEFLRKFPKATYAFLPAENPFDDDRRSSSKVVAIVDDEVYDIVSIIENRNNIFTKNCRINVYSYANLNLKEGESMIILPNPRNHLTKNFVDYFFRNEDAKVIRSKSASA